MSTIMIHTAIVMVFLSLNMTDSQRTTRSYTPPSSNSTDLTDQFEPGSNVTSDYNGTDVVIDSADNETTNDTTNRTKHTITPTSLVTNATAQPTERSEDKSLSISWLYQVIFAILIIDLFTCAVTVFIVDLVHHTREQLVVRLTKEGDDSVKTLAELSDRHRRLQAQLKAAKAAEPKPPTPTKTSRPVRSSIRSKLHDSD